MQISKAGVNVMEDSMPLADAVEKLHELAVPVAGQLIGIPVFLMVSLPQAREAPVQRLISLRNPFQRLCGICKSAMRQNGRQPCWPPGLVKGQKNRLLPA